MKGGKDEGKLMEPLHISDVDKGWPSGIVSQASLSNVASAKRKMQPAYGGIPRSSHLTEKYYSYFSGGVISSNSLTNTEQLMSGPASCQIQRASANLMKKVECNSVKPCGFLSCNNYWSENPGEENNLTAPSFLQSGETLNNGNLQLDLDKVTFSSISSGKLHNACLKLPKETKIRNQTMEPHSNLSEENSKLRLDVENWSEKPLLISSIGERMKSDSSLAGNKISVLGSREPQSNQHKKISSGGEQSRLLDPCSLPHQECIIPQKSKTNIDDMSTVTRKRCASAMDDSSHSSPQVGDCNELINSESMKECPEGEDSAVLQVGNVDRKQDISDTSMEDCILGLDLAHDEVVKVIGQRLFWKTRKMIVDQQRLFSVQIFELHRLIKVQRLIARSPELFHIKGHSHPNKPSIQFPQVSKLLYVSPLEPSPGVAKPKVNTLKSTSKPLPTLASIPTTDAKLPPWYFHPTPGNQWLVPVRSPSEGLIYKPYTGPCFPTVGFTAPIYGNYGPISLSTFGEHGSKCFSGNELGHGYFQPYAMPVMNASDLNLELDKCPPPGNAEFAIPRQSLCEVPSQQSAALSDCGGNLNSESSRAEPLERDALDLFPMTPSLQVLKDQSDDQRVQVIKVVPHNHKSAPASAARIFQSIQEERRKRK